MDVRTTARGIQVRASDDADVLNELLEAGQQSEDVVVHYRQVSPDEGLVSLSKPTECGSCGSSSSLWWSAVLALVLLLTAYYELR